MIRNFVQCWVFLFVLLWVCSGTLVAAGIGPGRFPGESGDSGTTMDVEQLKRAAESAQLDSDALLEVVASLLDSGEVDTAATVLESLLEREPDNLFAIYLRGVCRYYQQDQSGALADFDSFLREYPDYSGACYFRGLLAMDYEQNLESAREYFDCCLVADAGDVECLVSRGDAFFMDSQNELALADYEKAISLAPEDAEALFSRGLVYSAMDRYEQAAADTLKAAELDPEWIFATIESVHHLADLHAQENSPHTAEMLYSIVLEMDPENALAYYSRASVRYDLDHYPEALEDINAAMVYEPDDSSNYCMRGKIYHQTDELEKALSDFNHALELNQDPDAVRCSKAHRGMVYLDLQRLQEAMADLNDVLDQEPDTLVALTGRGMVFLSMEKYDEAIRDLNRAIELYPGFAQAYLYRGMAYGAQMDLNRAMVDMNKALELDPSVAEQLNEMLEEIKDLPEYAQLIEQRAQVLSQAVEKTPDDPLILYAHAVTLYRQGKAYEALTYLNKAEALDPDNYEIVYKRAGIYLENAFLDDAMQDIDRVLAIQPDHAEAYIVRGLLHTLAAHFKQAEKDFDRASELELDFEKSLLTLDYHKMRLKILTHDYEAVVRIFQSADPEMQQNLEVLYFVSLSHIALGDYDAALSILGRVQEYAGLGAATPIFIAGVLLHKGDTDGARQKILAMLEKAPGNVALLMKLTRIELTDGRPRDAGGYMAEFLNNENLSMYAASMPKAVKEFAALIDKGDPLPNADVLLEAAEKSFSQGRFQEAEYQFVQASLLVVDANPLVRAAQCSIELGNVDDAVLHIRDAMESLPREETILALRETARRAVGCAGIVECVADARKSYQQGLAVDVDTLRDNAIYTSTFTDLLQLKFFHRQIEEMSEQAEENSESGANE